MSASTGLVLVTGTITFGARWLETGTPDWRVIPATGAAAAGLALLEQLSVRLAVGIAAIGLITVLLAGSPGRPSPVAVLLKEMGYQTSTGAPAGGGGSHGKR